MDIRTREAIGFEKYTSDERIIEHDWLVEQLNKAGFSVGEVDLVSDGFIQEVPVGKVWGVGKVTENRLKSFAITTCKDLQTKDAGTSDVISRLEQDYGEQKFRVKEWIVTVSTIGNAFVLGGAVNGMLGSPQLSSGGEQLVLGSGSSAPPLIISGTEASGGVAFPTPWGTWGAEPIYN